MTLTNIKLSVVLLIGIGLTGLQAQEAIPALGSNASGSGGTVNYMVGQVVYTTNTGEMALCHKEGNSLMKFRLYPELNKPKILI